MSQVVSDTRKYRLKGFTPLLGSQSAIKEIRTAYQLEKNGINDERENEDLVERDEKGLTIFLQDTENEDYLYLGAYMIKGFFKEALATLHKQIGIRGVKGKADNFLFVNPGKVYILRDGAPIQEADDVFERPLRAETPMGPRVTLAGSELVEDPWTLEIEVVLVDNESTKMSKSLSWETIETALNYGQLKGLGQFRNGGYGRFTWEQMA